MNLHPFTSKSSADATFSWRILGCASQGAGGDDELRLRALLTNFDAELIPFNKRAKADCFRAILQALRTRGFDLFVLEGTGVAAGAAAILGRLLFGQPFVLSSGDAVEPFLTARMPLAKPIFYLYEKVLYKLCSGFIGWTPYLVGRALTLGAKRAVTAPGWAPHIINPIQKQDSRDQIRARLRIPAEATVFGIIGSLTWSTRYQYCYGLELVRAARIAGSSAHVIVVGSGDGLVRLQKAAGSALNQTIHLTGRIGRAEIPAYLAAMDIGLLPQSVDKVGSFRYSTKIAEYRSAGLPFVTNHVPMGYDLDRGDIWRLPGSSPWSTHFIEALADLMRYVDPVEIASHAAATHAPNDFDQEHQIRRVTAFLDELCVDLPSSVRSHQTDRQQPESSSIGQIS